MGLTANIWPVVDDQTGIVLRFFARAYALDSSDDLIESTLRALAVADFRMARAFRVPRHFVLISEHGDIEGAITIRGFQEQLDPIVNAALTVLEEDFAKMQGVAQPLDGGPLGNIVVVPRFGESPYIVVTTLIEDEHGRLTPQLGRQVR